MTNVLHLDSSARADGSVTRQLGQDLLAFWRSREPDLAVVHRDLAVTPPPFVTDAWVTAAFSSDPAQDRSALAESELLIDELLAADVLVVGAPMYNFGVPAALKAWVDQVVRVGRTFGYDGPRPIGLVSGIRAVVLAASGGDSTAYEQAGLDRRAKYLCSLLSFIGITDVRTLSVPFTVQGSSNLDLIRAQFALVVDGTQVWPEQRTPSQATTETSPA